MKQTGIATYKILIRTLIIALMMIILTPGLSNAQDIEKVDTAKVYDAENAVLKTAEKLIVSVPLDSGAHQQQLFMFGVRIKNKRVLAVKLQTGLSDIVELSPGDKLTFVIDNDSSMFVFNETAIRSATEEGVHGSNVRIHYPLPAIKEQRLINSKITGLRIDYSGGVFEFTLTAEQAEVIRDILTQIR
ncbi:hypothetical protein AAFN85_13770 [Mucilaginibacter sp. CAU 1740]|uniref:hypothetical protein n=1 Tax=Mucilaginibacter sp. CAU 1740 TaxID=3140365 RepID=UPI00325C2971